MKRTIAIASARYVQLKLICAMTGYTPDAIQKKIRNGIWIQGRQWQKAPDGHILIDMQGYEAWVEGRPAHLGSEG